MGGTRGPHSHRIAPGTAEIASGNPDPGRRQLLDLPEQVGASTDGDAACWAHLVCPECGSVVSEGHRPGCSCSPEGS